MNPHDGDARVCHHSFPRLCRAAQAARQDAGRRPGRSLVKAGNAVWPPGRLDPKGRPRFGTLRRCAPLVWNDQTARPAPCIAPNRGRHNRGNHE